MVRQQKDADPLERGMSPAAALVNLYWQECAVTTAQLAWVRPFQRINHWPGMEAMHTKVGLARCLRRMRELAPSLYDFAPLTFVLPDDWRLFVQQFRVPEGLPPNCGVLRSINDVTYIKKPAGSSQGKGILITRDLSDIDPRTPSVAQQYISNPFLIDGLKFDLRIYVMVSSLDPLRIWLFEDGLVRFATNPYEAPSNGNMADVQMHLTNYAINKSSANFVFNTAGSAAGETGSKRTLKWFRRWLDEHGHDSRAVWGAMADMIIKAVIAAQPHLAATYRRCINGSGGGGGTTNSSTTASNSSTSSGTNSNAAYTFTAPLTPLSSASDSESTPRAVAGGALGERSAAAAPDTRSHSTGTTAPDARTRSIPRCFEVLGLDVLLDTNLRPWLLEVNHSPSFTCDTPLDYEIKFALIGEAMDMLGLGHESRRKEDMEREAAAARERLAPSPLSSSSVSSFASSVPSSCYTVSNGRSSPRTPLIPSSCYSGAVSNGRSSPRAPPVPSSCYTGAVSNGRSSPRAPLIPLAARSGPDWSSVGCDTRCGGGVGRGHAHAQASSQPSGTITTSSSRTSCSSGAESDSRSDALGVGPDFGLAGGASPTSRVKGSEAADAIPSVFTNTLPSEQVEHEHSTARGYRLIFPLPDNADAIDGSVFGSPGSRARMDAFQRDVAGVGVHLVPSDASRGDLVARARLYDALLHLSHIAYGVESKATTASAAYKMSERVKKVDRQTAKASFVSDLYQLVSAAAESARESQQYCDAYPSTSTTCSTRSSVCSSGVNSFAPPISISSAGAGGAREPLLDSFWHVIRNAGLKCDDVSAEPPIAPLTRSRSESSVDSRKSSSSASGGGGSGTPVPLVPRVAVLARLNNPMLGIPLMHRKVLEEAVRLGRVQKCEVAEREGVLAALVALGLSVP